VIFNGVDLSQFFIVENTWYPILPNIEVVTQDVSGMDGTKYVGRRLQPITFTCQMLLKEPPSSYSKHEWVKRVIAPILYTDGLVPLRLTGDEARYYMAIVSEGTQLDSLWRHGGGEIEFYCPDPIAYGTTKTSKVVSGKSMTVGGTYKTSPIFRLRDIADKSNVMITNQATGHHVQIKSPGNTFGTTNIVGVNVDMGKEHCEFIKSNGAVESADPYVYFASTYFDMIPGEYVDFTLSPSTITATMEVTERWL
jgi:predicted phage tail component-like protein